MKKQLFYLMTGVMTVSILSLPSWAAFPGFEKMPVPTVKDNTESKPERSPDSAFIQLLSIHDALGQVPQLKQAQEMLIDQQKEYENAQKRFKAMTDCNIKRLADQFKDPAGTWDKITKAYDAREKDLAIYINSAEPSQQQPKEHTDIDSYSDQEIAEMLVQWSLGNDIMTDVYANQDKWGERKAPKSPSFPLWNDQKYLYDQTWNDFYIKLNTFFGVPPQGRPIIEDIVKYDYNRAGDVKAAHTAYIAKLSAKNPAKAAILPNDLKNGPAIAPRPLPPSRESVLYMGDVEKTQQVFPAWPEPWKKQIANGFQNYNPAGEFAKDFAGKSFKLKDTVTQEGPDKQNNRLNVYQVQKKAVDTAEKMIEVSKLNVSENKKALQKYLDQNGIKATADIDTLNAKSYEDLQNKLLEAQSAMIRDIEQNISKSDNQKTIAATIAAIKSDPKAVAYITTENAYRVEQVKLETAARDALLKEKKDFERKQRTQQNKPIDDMCLNGGV